MAPSSKKFDITDMDEEELELTLNQTGHMNGGTNGTNGNGSHHNSTLSLNTNGTNGTNGNAKELTPS
jgi:hypothetical protein